jgi:hypothetical protein
MGKSKNQTSEVNTSEVLPSTLEDALVIIEALKANIDELSAALASAETMAEKAKAVLTPTIEIDGDTYVINFGVSINGKNISAKELADDEVLCRELLSIEGQSFLTKEK